MLPLRLQQFSQKTAALFNRANTEQDQLYGMWRKWRVLYWDEKGVMYPSSVRVTGGVARRLFFRRQET